MSRDISPPPVKRRKVSAIPSGVSSPNVQERFVAPTPASPNTIRIYSWNINGIAPFLQRSITSYFPSAVSSPRDTKDAIPSASLRAFLHRHSFPELLLLQEVKISVKDTKTQEAVRRAVNAPLTSEQEPRKSPRYDVHFTLPTDRHNARGLGGSGKVYGVCSIVRSDLNTTRTNIRTVNWDEEGRISIIELSFASSKIAVFNIYAVNGTENPYRDPNTGAVTGTRHDRKLKFHKLLMEECLRLESHGWSIVLAGDFNVAPDFRDGHPKLRTWPEQHCINRADFLQKFLGRYPELTRHQEEPPPKVWHGMDIWREAHQEERRYTYYSRSREWGTSCDRVDYIVTSKDLWDNGHVVSCDILDSELERGPSDHVPVYVAICVEHVNVGAEQVILDGPS